MVKDVQPSPVQPGKAGTVSVGAAIVTGLRLNPSRLAGVMADMYHPNMRIPSIHKKVDTEEASSGRRLSLRILPHSVLNSQNGFSGLRTKQTNVTEPRRDVNHVWAGTNHGS